MSAQNVNFAPKIAQNGFSLIFGWWHGAAITRFVRSMKLLYAGPDMYKDG